MENKKKCEQNFLQKRFSNINLKKKEKKKKKKKGGRAQFVINFHEPNKSNIFYLFLIEKLII